MTNKVKVFIKKINLKRKIRTCVRVDYEVIIRLSYLERVINTTKREKLISGKKDEYYDNKLKQLEEEVSIYQSIRVDLKRDRETYEYQLKELNNK